MSSIKNIFYTKHMFTAAEYKSFGIILIQHLFGQDEFKLPGILNPSERDANEFIRKIQPETYHQRIREELSA